MPVHALAGADPAADAAVAALLGPGGRADPYPHYRVLRERAPVFALGEWVALTRYADCARVLRDPTFRVEDADYLDRTRPHWREHPSLVLLRGTALFSNGPAHERRRPMLRRILAAHPIAELRPVVRARAAHLVARLAARLTARLAEPAGAPVDFMTEFASLLPISVIAEILGVAPADWPRLRTLVGAMTAALDDDVDDADLAVADAAAVELTAFMTAHAGSTDSDVVPNLILLLAAGFDTTTNLFGTGLTLLLAHPAAVTALTTDPAAVVEEIVRYDSPVQVTSRWAAEDSEIGGVFVPAHSEAVVFLGAANRDPARFADPDRFDPLRADNHPLTFGAGAHFCLGAALARLEAQVAFPLLLERLPGLALAGEPVRRARTTLRGHTTMPITIAHSHLVG